MLNPDMTNDEIALDRQWVEDRSEYFISLYRQFGDDLRETRSRQRNLYQKSMAAGAQFGDLECEFLYLSMREMRPDIVVEAGSGVCWSTSWLLAGLRDNGHGHLTSYDLRDESMRLPPELKERWSFYKGDVLTYDLPEPIDFLLMDADHRCPFVNLFAEKVFPLVRPGGRICIHDVFAIATPAHGEAIVAYQYMDEVGIQCCTLSHCFPETFDKVQSVRVELGLGSDIHHVGVHSLCIMDVPDV